MDINQNYSQRPPIPAELRRRILVEAGHRCAIPSCRHIEVEVHHIIPWSSCQTHEYNNLIALCPNCHSRADKKDIDRKSLHLYKRNLQFAHDKFSQLEMDILFELFRLPQRQGLPWLGFHLILLKRLMDAKFIQIVVNPSGVFINGIRTSTDTIFITSVGLKFIEDLGLHEL